MRTIKIFNDEKEIYRGNCCVNTVIFRGKIYGDFKEIGQNGVKFSLQLSNGKDGSRVCAAGGRNSKPDEQEKAQRIANGSEQGDNAFDLAKTGEWNKPTFADCTAFGDILKEYKPKDEIWLIARYYSKHYEGKYYKGFIVREIIKQQEIEKTDKKIVMSSKLLYGEITALCNEKGYCWAINDYFSNLYSVSKKTISRWIKCLCEAGYISAEFIFDDKNKKVKIRYLKIREIIYPPDKNVPDNNTVNNTINIISSSQIFENQKINDNRVKNKKKYYIFLNNFIFLDIS